MVTAYWLNQAAQNNNQALSLVWALLTESLERRFDDAFGVIRSEQERNDRLSQQIQILERDLTKLGEAYAQDDEIRNRLTHYEQWFQEHGIDLWEPSPAEQ